MSSFEEREAKVSLNEIFPVICETLESGASVTFKPHGTSMLPLLRQGRDSVTLKKPQKPLKKYDIIFYRRKTGQFVLHRIVGKKADRLIIRGDNQLENEYGINADMIIGVVTHISRDGKKISCRSASYWFYVMFLRPLRGIKLRVGRLLGKIKSK
ncbi:MAG: S24/S26 family peptidase [Clostridia bacterium]|nr:S24/S26 family peptidase [Clostridia bacterium]